MDAYKAQQLALELMREHDLLADGWRFAWSRGKRQLGAAQIRRTRNRRTGQVIEEKTIKLSRHLVALNGEDEIRDTILHEIAHALAGLKNGHIKDTLRHFLEYLKADDFIQSHPATLCTLCGEPSIWTRDEQSGLRIIEHRGSLVKIPYFADLQQDIAAFSHLSPFSLSDLTPSRFQEHIVLGLCPRLEHFRGGRPHSFSGEKNVATESEAADLPPTPLPTPASSSGYPLSSSCYKMCGTNVPPETKDNVADNENPAHKAHSGVGGLSPDNPNSEIRKMWAVWEWCTRNGKKATLGDVDSIYKLYINECRLGKKSEKQRKDRIRHAIRNCQWDPEKAGNPYGFKPGAYLKIVKERVPDDAYTWNRREKLTPDRLADFVGLVLQDAFDTRKQDGYEGRGGRESMRALSKHLKDQGLISWVLTSHLYTKLLRVACEHELLAIYAPHEPPQRSSDGKRIKTASGEHKGRARLIGPGPALGKAYWAWQQRLKDIKQKEQTGQDKAA